MIRIVFLDRASLPVPLPRLDVPHEWTDYGQTATGERLERARDADVLVVNKVMLDAALLEQLPRLRLVAVSATGVNNVDLAACRARGIPVCNVRNYGADTVAEHAFMLMMVLRRQLATYQRAVRAGDWQRSERFCLFGAPIGDLKGARLVIAGAGDIGQALAHKARAFGMDVRFMERREAGCVRPGYVSFDEGLETSDVLSLHLPLNDATRNMLGRAELLRMKPGAVLVNTARGGLVDEAALAEVLSAGHLGGAGFDVLTQEPPRDGNPLLELTLDNLLLTPHVAWASEGAMQTMARMLVDNIAAWMQGQPQNVVN
ncbi:D-2-hydroxyacid dehydrogenase [Laribacter hongkongensis]|uniref:D-2-hydroxyacid dehydrogenase n=1 Tax=Laribacter hongkongensis TaxID=168471 RepID=UPI001EFE91FD|nr:D-2-hydroxyacid dehydrogenase [Laribacter hongkongensis]MCG9058033.1 D-2-hydroxyacid dehydrogenase [Laribacter hongkongensis]MCG9084505.1 D-2-hydroxyacid dehydrogenase [Laribacter hongkongensis]